MTVINLQKDLEVMYAPSPQTFHNGRNQLMDLSGYGRHATASGGPTISDDGPDDFGQIDTNGIDADLQHSNIEISGSWTVAFLIRQSTSWSNYEYITDPTYEQYEQGVIYFNQNGTLVYSDQGGFGSLPEKKWGLGVIRHDGSGTACGHILYDDVVDTDTRQLSDDTTLRISSIFGGQTETRAFEGQMAYFGTWSRFVSFAEIGLLNDLTAVPRGYI